MNQQTTTRRRDGTVVRRPHGITIPNLQDWRMYKCLTQTKLAQLAGTSITTVNGIESRDKSASFRMVEKLANALGYMSTRVWGLGDSHRSTSALTLAAS